MKNKNFERIYKKYHTFSKSIAYHIVLDRHLAEDVVQEVFMEFYKEIDRMDCSNENDIKSWISNRSYYRSVDIYRKAYRHNEVWMKEKTIDTYRTELNPEDILIRQEEIQLRKEALQELRKENPVSYQLLVRTTVANEPQEIVAADAGVRIGTLRTRIHRARSWMMDEFQKKLGG